MTTETLRLVLKHPSRGGDQDAHRGSDRTAQGPPAGMKDLAGFLSQPTQWATWQWHQGQFPETLGIWSWPLTGQQVRQGWGG